MTRSAPSSTSSSTSRSASRALAGIHLIGAPIAKGGSGFGRFAERPVERGGVLGGVGDDGRVSPAVRIEQRADRGHAPVHHVARRHGIRAGARVVQRDLRQCLDRGVIVDDAVRRSRGRSGRDRSRRTGTRPPTRAGRGQASLIAPIAAAASPCGSSAVAGLARPCARARRTAAPPARRWRLRSGLPSPPRRPRAGRCPACSPTAWRVARPGTTNSRVDEGVGRQARLAHQAPPGGRTGAGAARSLLRKSHGSVSRLQQAKSGHGQARAASPDRRSRRSWPRATQRACRGAADGDWPRRWTAGAGSPRPRARAPVRPPRRGSRRSPPPIAPRAIHARHSVTSSGAASVR